MELTKEAIARVCHEANRAYCMALGDHTQPTWDQAAEWMKDSAIAGVDEALKGATPERLHAAWVEKKIADGWRLGPVKAPELKEHPCLVPYAQLTPEQKAKDALFHGIVNALRAGLPVIDVQAFLSLPTSPALVEPTPEPPAPSDPVEAKPKGKKR